jgi:hypothetical protein
MPAETNHPAEINRPAAINGVVPSDPSLLPSSGASPELPFAKPFTVPFAALIGQGALIGQSALSATAGTRLSAMMAPSVAAVPPMSISTSAYTQFP